MGEDIFTGLIICLCSGGCLFITTRIWLEVGRKDNRIPEQEKAYIGYGLLFMATILFLIGSNMVGLDLV